MTTFIQLRRGLNNAWDTVVDGWQHLRDLASHAITRFTPDSREVETASDQIALSGSRWGLLTTEVQETDDDVEVRLEAPGMEIDDFDITISDHYLIVRGEKRVEEDRKQGGFHIMECAYGRFERAIPLPTSVQEDKARARYKRGVLRIELPKLESSKRRHIKVVAR